MRLRNLAALAGPIVVLSLLGCSASPPARPRPPAKETEAPPETSLDRLKALVLAEHDPVMEKVLLDLLAAETDGRAQHYLEAGRMAWLSERVEMAGGLWRTALECGPRTERRFEIDDRTTLSLVRLAPADIELGTVDPTIDPYTDALLATAGLPEGILTLEDRGWVLRVSGPSDADALERLRIETQRVNADRLFRVRIDFVEADPAAIPPEFRPLFAPSPVGGHALPADQTERLRAALEAETWSELLAAPTLTCFPFQKANLFVGTQSAYIADYEVGQGPRGWTADPVIRTFDEGVRASVRCAAVAEGRILCHVVTSVSRLEGPLAQHEVSLWEGGPDVTIETPSLVEVEGTLLFVQPGPGARWLRLGRLRDPATGQPRECGFLVEVEPLALDESQPPKALPGKEGPIAALE